MFLPRWLGERTPNDIRSKQEIEKHGSFVDDIKQEILENKLLYGLSLKGDRNRSFE